MCECNLKWHLVQVKWNNIEKQKNEIAVEISSIIDFSTRDLSVPLGSQRLFCLRLRGTYFSNVSMVSSFVENKEPVVMTHVSLQWLRCVPTNTSKYTHQNKKIKNKNTHTDVSHQAELLNCEAYFLVTLVEGSWSISLREASHSRCSIPSFLSSIRPCSTEHPTPKLLY